MNLIDKVKKLVANMQRAITDLKAIKTALIENGAEIPEGTTTSDYAGKISEVYENGINSAKNPIKYATQLYNAFYEAVFPAGYEMELDIPNVQQLSYAFWSARGIKKVTIKGITDERAISFRHCFRACSTLETLDLSNINVKIADGTYSFMGANALKQIIGVMDLTSCESVTNMFHSCTSLEYVRFKEETILLSIAFSYSQNLSAESVQSIIDGLATVETQQTLTLHSTVKANLTIEQKTTILTKNWVVM